MKQKQSMKRCLALVLAIIMMLPASLSVMASEETETTSSDWTVGGLDGAGTVIVTGDAEAGYELNATAEHVAAAMNRKVDFSQELVQFSYKQEEGKWAYLLLSESKPDVAANLSDLHTWGGRYMNGRLTIAFQRSGSDLKLICPANWDFSREFGTIKNFAWDEQHTLGFVLESGNYYLKIDDEVFRNPTGVETQTWMNAILGNFKNNSGGYLTFGNHDQGTVLPTSIKVVSASIVTVTAKNVDDGNTEVTEAFLQGGGIYEKGELVTVTAPAEDPEKYTFLGWYNANDLNNFLSRERSYTFEVKEDVALVALYKPVSTDVQIVVVDGDSREFQEVEVGTIVSLNAKGAVDKFQYWTNQFGMIVSREVNYSFYAASSDVLTAHYDTEIEKAIVIWESDYGQVIGRGFYSADDTIIAPAVPSRLGYTAVGWNMGADKIKAAIAGGQKMITVRPEYTAETKQYTVMVVGGILEGETGTTSKLYKVNEVATVTANDATSGEKFSHWIGYPTGKEEEEKILSYSATYKFYVSQDYTVKAVFVKEGDAVVVKPTANIVQTECFVEGGVNKIHFVSVLTVPEGCTIEYGGILATAVSGKIEKNADGTDTLKPETADFVRGKQSNAKMLQFTWTKTNVTDGQKWYVCPYLVYRDSNNELHTIVGEMVTGGFNIDISQAQYVE